MAVPHGLEDFISKTCVSHVGEDHQAQCGRIQVTNKRIKIILMALAMITSYSRESKSRPH